MRDQRVVSPLLVGNIRYSHASCSHEKADSVHRRALKSLNQMKGLHNMIRSMLFPVHLSEILTRRIIPDDAPSSSTALGGGYKRI